MKAKGLIKLLNNLKMALSYKHELEANSPLWDYIVSEKLKLKSYSLNDLSLDISILNDFDKNKIWERSFYGLKKHESISACAVPLTEKLKSVKQLLNEMEIAI